MLSIEPVLSLMASSRGEVIGPEAEARRTTHRHISNEEIWSESDVDTSQSLHRAQMHPHICNTTHTRLVSASNKSIHQKFHHSQKPIQPQVIPKHSIHQIQWPESYFQNGFYGGTERWRERCDKVKPNRKRTMNRPTHDGVDTGNRIALQSWS
jgi:hypothetical protein